MDTSVQRRAIRPTSYALLVAESLAEPLPALRLDIPATVPALRPMRQDLGDWLAGLGVVPGDLNALQHAVWEACGNAVEHAYRDNGSADRAPTLARGGALPLTVDLTGVTHLASVGVRLLFQLSGTRNAAGVRLSAGAGTPADQVLTLTGLEHA